MDDEEFPMVVITDSTAINAAGWKDGLLHVEFVRGEVYEYQVPEVTFKALMLSNSKGRFMRGLVGVRIN